jgi:hypothetical protein
LSINDNLQKDHALFMRNKDRKIMMGNQAESIERESEKERPE